MPKIFLPFGKLSPDLGHFNNPGMLDVRNVIPLSGKYVAAGGNTVKAAIGTVAATAGNAPLTRGIHAHSKGAGAYDVYVGRQTSLKKFDPAAAWAQIDVSRTVGGAYNCLAAGGENGWQFCSAGGTVIATNGADAVQAKLAGAATFENLFTSTKKPLAKFVMMVNENLVCCNVTDGATAMPRRAWWTQSNAFQNIGDRVNNPTFIGTGFQDLEDELGHITGCIGMGGYGYIFKEEGIIIMSGPEYRFDKIRGTGLVHPNAIAPLGEDVYYWRRGPCRIRNGVPQALGRDTLFRFFNDDIRRDTVALVNAETYDGVEHLWCRPDVVSGMVFWGLTTEARNEISGTSSSHAYQQVDLIVCYNEQDDRISFIDPSDSSGPFGPGIFVGIPYAATRPPALFTRWTPGQNIVAVERFIYPDAGVATFDDKVADILGSNQPSNAIAFEFPYTSLVDNQEVSIVALRPVFRMSGSGGGGDGVAITATVRSRPRFWDPPVTATWSTRTEDGWIHANEPTTRYEFHSVRLEFENGTDSLMNIEELEGVQVEYEGGGPTSRRA